MGKRLTEILTYVAEARARVLEAAARFDQEALDRRPSPDAWSPGEILAHLALLDAAVTRILDRQVASARGDGIGPDPSDQSLLASLDAFELEETVVKIQTPGSFVPTRGLSREKLLADLADSRAAFLAAAERARGVDLSRLQFPHPALGRLDMYQWVLFLGKHDLRHLHQMERAGSGS
jgi:hypothetical protein